LGDAKIRLEIETFDVEMFGTYSGAHGWRLART
jgi:hypothetical protein